MKTHSADKVTTELEVIHTEEKRTSVPQRDDRQVREKSNRINQRTNSTNWVFRVANLWGGDIIMMRFRGQEGRIQAHWASSRADRGHLRYEPTRYVKELGHRE
jgi:hypothetical protein